MPEVIIAVAALAVEAAPELGALDLLAAGSTSTWAFAGPGFATVTAAGAAGGFGATLLQSLGGVALSFGISALVGSLRKNPDIGSFASVSASPQSVQNTIKQAIAPRLRHYGKVKIGGTAAFYESKDGKLYVLICISSGEIDSFIEHWLSNTIITLDINGYVTDDQYQYGDNGSGIVSPATSSTSRVLIIPKLGQDDQVAHQTLIDAFPTLWDSNCRGRGIANVLAVFQDVPAEVFRTVYPNNAPQYRTVINASKVFDPRDLGQSSSDKATWLWSDNPPVCILDYLTHADGMGRPRSMFNEASFAAAADACDEEIPLKAGGTEKRYRLSGTYDLTERPSDVLARMLATCDGVLYPMSDGTWGLRVGIWYPPGDDAVLDDTEGQVISYSVEQRVDALKAFNQLKVFYVSGLHDYQETECEQWEDADLLELYGEQKTNEIHLPMVPSPSQARRLAKIAMAKANPKWSGTVISTLAGLKLLGEPTFTQRLSELAIDETFTVSKFKIAGDLSSSEIGIVSLDASVYDWDPETEEGDPPPVPPDSPSAQPPPIPSGFVPLIGSVVLQGGSNASVIVASWDAPQRDSVAHEVNYRKVGIEDWTSARIPSTASSWSSGPLEDGEDYEVRLRATAPGGVSSEWTSTSTLTATADVTPPNPVTSFASLKAGSNVTLSWINPNSPNFYKTVIYRGTTSTFAAAVPIATLYGTTGGARNYADNALANGTYYWWAVAMNASNVAATEVGPQTQTIP